ncbi:MAG: TIGR02757 family protein [Leptonema sp. (in: bacteria)]
MNFKDYLDFVCQYYHKIEYIQTDPLRYVYWFKTPKEKEFIGLLVALFSYGNRKAIFQFLDRLILNLYPNPLEKIQEINLNSLDLYYRFQSKKDIQLILEIFKEILMENSKNPYIFFNEFGFTKNKTDIFKSIDNFQNRMEQRIPKKFNTFGIKHYFTFSDQSLAKRYCLFFRWMVRDAFPDLRIYSFLDKKDLMYPVDVHILNFAYQFKIIQKKYSKRETAIKITNFFKNLNPSDPLYYDFYLTRDLMLNSKFKEHNVLF